MQWMAVTSPCAFAQEKGPAAGAAKAGAAAPVGDGEAKPIKQQKSFLMWLYTANGPYFTVAFLAQRGARIETADQA